MRVLLLSRYDRQGASSRLRHFQYLPALESEGFEVTVAPFFSADYLRGLYAGERLSALSVLKSYLGRLRHLAACGKFDLVWLQRELFPWLPALGEALMERRGIPLVVDFDDAVFHRYDQHRSAMVRALLGRKIDAVMRHSALVITGNAYLAERARAAGARRVEILPTVVDLGRYIPAEPRYQEPFTIGWIGTPLTASYLSEVQRPLESLSQMGAYRLIAVGAGPLRLGQVPVEVLPWSEQSETELLRRFDVGIMPLPDKPWERGKCGYKLIQYMACALPVVASPVGVNCQIVQHGQNGFLAETHEDWVRSLSCLQSDKALRQSMGSAGRSLVEQKFSLQAGLPRLLSLLRQAAET